MSNVSYNPKRLMGDLKTKRDCTRVRKPYTPQRRMGDLKSKEGNRAGSSPSPGAHPSLPSARSIPMAWLGEEKTKRASRIRSKLAAATPARFPPVGDAKHKRNKSRPSRPQISAPLEESAERDDGVHQSTLITTEEDAPTDPESIDVETTADCVAARDPSEQQEGENEEPDDSRGVQKKRFVVFLAAGAASVILVTTVLSLVFAVRSDDKAASSAETEHKMEGRLKTLLPEFSWTAINESQYSPQAKGLRFLKQDKAFLRGDYSDQRIVQRFALATIYYSLGGLGWEHQNGWLSYDQHECFWHSSFGAADMNDDNATDANGIDAASKEVNTCVDNPISGNKQNHPDPDLIQHLHLQHNNLHGDLPQELYLLTNLKTLHLNHNEIKGTISTEIGLLESLEEFDLQGNNLSGQIPSELGVWLLEINLSENELTGPIPSELGSFGSLKTLDLSENVLTGSLPTGLFALTALKILALDDNELTGTIAARQNRLRFVQKMLLQNNNFRGTIPYALCLESQVSELEFDCNEDLCGCDCQCKGGVQGAVFDMMNFP